MRLPGKDHLVRAGCGGTVLAQFNAILAATVPELTGRVRAVKFDANGGRLDIVPDAPAVGTKLRWSAPKLIAAANQTVPGANVRTLNTLAPAPVRPPQPRRPPPLPRGRPRLPRRCSNQRRRPATAAHHQTARSSRTDPGIEAAVERQTAALRALSHRAFPEPPAPNGAPAPIGQARTK
ncbi:hypothetical protein ACFVWY_10330 [Streptomyces sp. NPDC058195]|uniref:hypothetical protein n=1 Tax=Streptomyces sp. NPDC058195 TaxID=3346375 RepID=UPI0036E0C94C